MFRWQSTVRKIYRKHALHSKLQNDKSIAGITFSPIQSQECSHVTNTVHCRGSFAKRGIWRHIGESRKEKMWFCVCVHTGENEIKYVQLYFCALHFSYLLKKDKNWEKEPLGADGRAFSIRWKYLRLRAGQLIFLTGLMALKHLGRNNLIISVEFRVKHTTTDTSNWTLGAFQILLKRIFSVLRGGGGFLGPNLFCNKT